MNKVYSLFVGSMVKMGTYKQPINECGGARTMTNRLSLPSLRQRPRRPGVLGTA